MKSKYELAKFQSSLTKYMEINLEQNCNLVLGLCFINFIQGCLITSCLNGGSCVPDHEKQTFSCSCQQPWTGDICEVKRGKLQ